MVGLLYCPLFNLLSFIVLLPSVNAVLLEVTLCLCLGWFDAALRRNPSRRSWKLGKLLSTHGLNPLGLESFAGSAAVIVGS